MFHGLEGLDGGGALHLDLGGEHHLLDGDPGDSVTLADSGGTTVYADLDGDGVIDHISSVHADGRYDIWTTDPHRAAWGLAVPEPVKSSSGEPLAWGLSAGVTPESVAANQGVSMEKARWRRIDGG